MRFLISEQGTNSSAIPVLLAAGILVFPIDALAYIDPGAGSVLLQSLLGVIVAGSALAAAYWHRLRRYLLRLKGKNEHE